MSEWSIFWICLFSYWTIKEVVELLTYNRRKAIKELAREECRQEISEECQKICGDFLNGLEELSDDSLQELSNVISKFVKEKSL